jgi:AcrR family transcriptional regulator
MQQWLGNKGTMSDTHASNSAQSAKPARRSQAERTASTSARLISAAIASLHENGYSATSTSYVAKMAGVSRGAMLHHFTTKVALMAAVVRATYQSDIDAYSHVINDIKSGKDALNTLIDTAWARFCSPGGIAQTELWLAVRSDPELAAAILPVREEIDANSVEVLSLVLKQYGFDTQVSIEGLLCYLISTLRGLSIQKILGSPLVDLEAAVGIIKLLPALTVKLPDAQIG